jgi:hypothetical protein
VARLQGRQGETIGYDFWLLGPEGRVAVTVEDYRARALVSLEAAPRSAARPPAAPLPGGAR